MKALSLILLVANLAVAGFFLGRDHLPLPPDPRHAPLHIERIALGAPQRPDRLPDATDAAMRCVAWRGFDAHTYLQAREQLVGLVGERPLSFTEVASEVRSWVVFPPLPSVQAAQLKMREFSTLGIRDTGLVTEGAWRNGVSLGLYDNPESAQKRLRELEARGVHAARVVELPRADSSYHFVVKGPADLAPTLAALRDTYPGSSQEDVACPP